MPYFPKVQNSWAIQNLVAALNSKLGGQYFTIRYLAPDETHAFGWYELNPTNLCIKHKRYLSIHLDGGLIFSDMYHYLSGILIGFDAAIEKQQKK